MDFFDPKSQFVPNKNSLAQFEAFQKSEKSLFNLGSQILEIQLSNLCLGPNPLCFGGNGMF